MISFVVPAHNEEAAIGRTLQAINDSATDLGEPFEMIVANDASTDRTAEIARERGARVVDVNHRQIAATRNSGARAARGDQIFFIDADTTVNPRAVRAALKAMDKGAVGGGAMVRMDGWVPLYVRLLELILRIPATLAGFCGGAFMFCTKQAFEATGGFDERLFWAEEGAMGFALKRLGRFVIIWPTVLTSGRRMRVMSGFDIAVSLLKTATKPVKLFTSRAAVQRVWYDSNRTRDDELPNGVLARASNAIALIVTLSLLAGPLWSLIPWSQTPLSSAFGKFRFANAAFICHVALLFWPAVICLLWNLFRQKWSREWLRLALLAALCFWQAIESTQGVFWIWSRVVHWALA